MFLKRSHQSPVAMTYTWLGLGLAYIYSIYTSLFRVRVRRVAFDNYYYYYYKCNYYRISTVGEDHEADHSTLLGWWTLAVIGYNVIRKIRSTMMLSTSAVRLLIL